MPLFTPAGASAADVSSAVSTHASDTTAVHGFTDTAATQASFTAITANTQTDSYTLVLTDAGKCVEMNKGTANDLTVPLHSSVAFATGTVIEVFQVGAGQTTIVATGGVTISSSGGKLKLTGQYSGASLRKTGTDTWALVGDIAT